MTNNSNKQKKSKEIFSILEKKISPQFFNAFFSQMYLKSLDKEQVIFSADSNKVLSHIKNKYKKDVELAVKTVLKEKKNVIFEKPSQLNTNKKSDYYEKNHKNTSLKSKKSVINFYPNKINLNPQYTFENFVTGPSNEQALAACMGAAKNPNDYHNPLYLYGSTGLGKTHLMMSIGNYIQKELSFSNIQYVPSEIFQSDLVDAYKNKSISQFHTKYRNADVFLFDDIQFITAKAEATQEALFNTFNFLYQNKKQIVISGDRPPRQLSKLTDRLKTRFQSGLIVDIKPPNFETRKAILISKAKNMQLEVPSNVISYIASSITDQIRVLEAALIKLKFISEFEKRPVDIQMAKLTLKDLPSEKNETEISIDEILRVVSKTYILNEKDILGSSKVSHIVLARHICMYLTRKLVPSLPLKKIAQAFGRNDHTTVMHAEKKIIQLIDKDDALRVQLSEMEEELSF